LIKNFDKSLEPPDSESQPLHSQMPEFNLKSDLDLDSEENLELKLMSALGEKI